MHRLPCGLCHIVCWGDFQPGINHALANVLIAFRIGCMVEQRRVDKGGHQAANLDPVSRPFAIEAFRKGTHAEFGG